MWALGLASNGSSIALARTLACADSGQPPPKRFDPHARQKVFALPSAGWNVCSRASPSTMRMVFEGTRPFTVPVPPDSFLQLEQWQYLSVSGASTTSNLTPPQRQLPLSFITSTLTPASRQGSACRLANGSKLRWFLLSSLLAVAGAFLLGRATATESKANPHVYVLREGVVRVPAAATRCEASGEGGFPDFVCSRLPRGLYTVSFFSDDLLVFRNGKEDPVFSARWEP